MSFLNFCDIDYKLYKKYRLNSIQSIKELKFEDAGNGIIEGCILLHEKTSLDTPLVQWIPKDHKLKISGTKCCIKIQNTFYKSACKKIKYEEIEKSLCTMPRSEDVAFLHLLALMARSVISDEFIKKYRNEMYGCNDIQEYQNMLQKVFNLKNEEANDICQLFYWFPINVKTVFVPAEKIKNPPILGEIKSDLHMA